MTDGGERGDVLSSNMVSKRTVKEHAGNVAVSHQTHVIGMNAAIWKATQRAVMAVHERNLRVLK